MIIMIIMMVIVMMIIMIMMNCSNSLNLKDGHHNYHDKDYHDDLDGDDYHGMVDHISDGIIMKIMMIAMMIIMMVMILIMMIIMMEMVVIAIIYSQLSSLCYLFKSVQNSTREGTNQCGTSAKCKEFSQTIDKVLPFNVFSRNSLLKALYVHRIVC